MADARDTVRLSLRLITTSRLIEREVDSLMRARFGSTIARFDFLSALDRHGALTLGEVSQYLLVSNGNVTQLRTRLFEDGLIETEADQNDRRIQRVRLTPRRAKRIQAHGQSARGLRRSPARRVSRNPTNKRCRGCSMPPKFDAPQANEREVVAVNDDAWNSADYHADALSLGGERPRRHRSRSTGPSAKTR